MSGTETVSAPCPNCGKSMYQKYESSLSGFMFDACFTCGYASGEANREELSAMEVWQSILSHFNCETIEGLVNKEKWLDGDIAPSDFKEPIFVPDKDLAACIVDIKRIINP